MSRLVGDEVTRALCRVQSLKDEASKLYGRSLGKRPPDKLVDVLIELERMSHNAKVYARAEQFEKSDAPEKQRAACVAEALRELWPEPTRSTHG